MCKGMNCSIVSVLLGSFGATDAGPAGEGQKETRPVKQGSSDRAAFILKNSSKVIIVPGCGMAVAQAQHALREMADHLKKDGELTPNLDDDIFKAAMVCHGGEVVHPSLVLSRASKAATT